MFKDSSVYLSEDVSKATMNFRSVKLPELKQRRSEGLIAYFSETKVITEARVPNEQQDKDRDSENELSQVSGNSPDAGDSTPNRTRLQIRLWNFFFQSRTFNLYFVQFFFSLA